MNDNFISELKGLLLKYNASIELDYADCSDTYGMYDVRMLVSVGNKTLVEVDGWSIEAEDL